MLHEKVCIDYCKILENVEVFTPCKSEDNSVLVRS